MAELVTREEAQKILVARDRSRLVATYAERELSETVVALYDRIEELEAALLKHPNLNLSAVLGYDAGKDESAARIAELEREVYRMKLAICSHELIDHVPDADGRMVCPICFPLKDTAG